MMRQINFDPESDNGEFIPSPDYDITTEPYDGIYKIPEIQAKTGFKWFVRVGGGYQGYTYKRNALAYYNFN